MKKNKMFIVLAALAASAGFAIAQDEAPRAPLPPIAARAPVPPPPEDALIAVSTDETRLAASQDQLKQADRAMASSQKAMQLAQARTGGGGGGSGKAFAYSLGGPRSGSISRALVIPKDASDAKNLAEVGEDMNVMAHILDKAASGDDKTTRAMGIAVFGRIPGGGGAPQNLYLEGYGAVFFENVNFPLLPPPTKENEAETKEKTNSEWEEARKEMARPSGGADAFAVAGESFERFEREFSWGGNPPSPYDTDKVEDLKKDLISALKNVANIRKLKADETVTVVVTGASANSNGRTIKRNGPKPAPVKDDELAVPDPTAGERTPASTPGKLILRARKADAEAFQNGKLNADEFRKKVTVMLY